MADPLRISECGSKVQGSFRQGTRMQWYVDILVLKAT